ncbi:MAG TPA: monofunctional biosynthetic peptidoglycan transglycosylase [Rhizomicrobium sp.]|nr:monofunctional biosynthetic peptidoglycan transglycosylase [Rhizomicrobium sp.]
MRKFLRSLWFRDDGRTPWVRRMVVIVFVFLVPLPVLYLLVFRFLPVPLTPQMALDVATFQPVHQTWRASDEISFNLKRAVIGSEDQNFCNHHGFDWDDIQQAVKQHERHPRRQLRGASTISQQVARTLFLLPVRSWVRKGVEAYLTVLVEAIWPKDRILTAYLNLVDWGRGNYGAAAAAEAYFHVPASMLSKSQSARLAATLPNPDHRRAASSSRFITSDSERIMRRAWEVERDELDWCIK